MEMKMGARIANALRRKRSAMMNSLMALLCILSQVSLGWLRIPDQLYVCLNDDKERRNGV